MFARERILPAVKYSFAGICRTRKSKDIWLGLTIAERAELGMALNDMIDCYNESGRPDLQRCRNYGNITLMMGCGISRMKDFMRESDFPWARVAGEAVF